MIGRCFVQVPFELGLEGSVGIFQVEEERRGHSRQREPTLAQRSRAFSVRGAVVRPGRRGGRHDCLEVGWSQDASFKEFRFCLVYG